VQEKANVAQIIDRAYGGDRGGPIPVEQPTKLPISDIRG